MVTRAMSSLLPPDDFQQELQDFDVPFGLGERRAPRVEAVALQQKRMRAGVGVEQRADTPREPPHVLVVRNDRHPFAMLVRADAIEALQHFEALERKPARVRVAIRKYGAPNGMGVQDGASTPGLDNREVERGFGGRLPHAACWPAL